MKFEEKIEELGRKFRHQFHKRNEHKAELVRMLGDWDDSRITFFETDGEIEGRASVWNGMTGETEWEGAITYSEDEDNQRKFFEQIENALGQMNHEFERIAKENNENPDEW